MARHLRIQGTVQGVGYRAGFAAQAQSLRLSGWVRNRFDGSVEAIVDGPDEAVSAMIAWARRGPPASQVREVQIDEADEAGHQPGRFDILPSA
jgi:acylphosphatase